MNVLLETANQLYTIISGLVQKSPALSELFSVALVIGVEYYKDRKSAFRDDDSRFIYLHDYLLFSLFY